MKFPPLIWTQKQPPSAAMSQNVGVITDPTLRFCAPLETDLDQDVFDSEHCQTAELSNMLQSLGQEYWH